MRKKSSTNYENQKSIIADCPITSTLQQIGGRWKLIIIWNLKNEPLRYSILKKRIPNISEKMLTQQLKSLVEHGWVVRKDFGEIPPRTEYKLTDLGMSFIPVMNQIYDWGIKNEITKKATSAI